MSRLNLSVYGSCRIEALSRTIVDPASEYAEKDMFDVTKTG